MRVLTRDDIDNCESIDFTVKFQLKNVIHFNFELQAGLSGNIFYSTGNELKPLNICIPELAQVTELGGSDEN